MVEWVHILEELNIRREPRKKKKKNFAMPEKDDVGFDMMVLLI